MTSNENIVICDDEKQTIASLVAYLLTTVATLANTRKHITIGLSGGSFINIFSAEMAKNVDKFKPYSDKIIFIFCDERFVPLNSSDSTYFGFSSNNFFKNLEIPDERVYSIRADAKTVEECALDYEKRLKPLLNSNNGFDILFLGMGPDGHTCSLFPGHKLFTEAAGQTNVVMAISDSPKPPPARVTLTLNYINNSDNLVFFTIGEGKAEMLRKILVEKDKSLPCTHVQPKHGKLRWFLDKPAAKLLE
jgi:6-phosphogluconolactonase